MAFRPEDARACIAEVRWLLAETMAQWLHEYVREWRPDLGRSFP
jgi:hypothetical protein